VTPNGWQSRRLVPRWRTLAETVASGELALPRGGAEVGVREFTGAMASRLERWRLTPDLVRAAELVETAIMEGREQDGVEAAKHLLSEGTTAAPLVKEQAISLLTRLGRGGDIPQKYAAPAETAKKSIRGLLELNPTDALNWVDLAFLQTVGGHAEAAARSMAVALQLAPNNRHVLRSAARLYLHRGDPGAAHELLLKNSATPFDPWLMAGEIALSELADKSPKFFKSATRWLSDSGLPARQLSELAGAAATIELVDGSRKRSKRLFVQSVADPTGSALAQAEWATPSLGVEIVEPDRLQSTAEPFEAEAFHLYREAKFLDVAAACDKWSEVDPVSIRPFEFGSTSAGHAQDLKVAEDMARRGLKKRPSSPLLLNCLAYALASSDRPDEAAEYLRKVKLPNEEAKLAILTKANWGLIEFRRGNHDEGTSYYRAAIDEYSKEGFKIASAHARVYFAREALRAELPNAPKLLSEAQSAMKPFGNTEAVGVLRELEIKVGQEPRRVPSFIAPDGAGDGSQPTPLPKRDIRWVIPNWTSPWSETPKNGRSRP
jgi:Tfp pilus assembly protein PilF